MNLTPREITSVRKLAQGLTVKEVADQLYVAPSTVVTHKKNIYKKTEAKTLVQLGVMVAQSGILSFIILLICISIVMPLRTQTVPDLTSNIPPSHGFATIADIEATFNNARRQEELQLGLPANTMSDLSLPDESTWDGYTEAQQMLYLLNDERVSRNGIEYDTGEQRTQIIPIFLCPFEGMSSTLDGIAQGHADYLRENDMFTHIDENGDDAFERVQNHPDIIGKINLLFFVESIASIASTEPTGILVAALEVIYEFIFQDLVSEFKHRQMFLLGKQMMPGYFVDDHEDIGKEGYLGIGISTGSYFGLPFAKVFVIDYIDPLADENFNTSFDTDLYNLVDCPDMLLISGPVTPQTDGIFQTSGYFESDSHLMPGADMSVNAVDFIEFKQNFSIDQGATFEADNNTCDN